VCSEKLANGTDLSQLNQVHILLFKFNFETTNNTSEGKPGKDKQRSTSTVD